MTGTAETDENVSQGTVDSGLVSSSSIAKGTNDVFKDSDSEITYGGTKVQP